MLVESKLPGVALIEPIDTTIGLAVLGGNAKFHEICLNRT